jgi:IclR family pca regulon transcriptional regulator
MNHSTPDALIPRAEEAPPAQDAPPAGPRPGDTYVQSFARGLAVIRSFSAQAPAQSLSEVAARTGLTRAGARRILLTLEGLGYVQSEGRQFRLTPKILDLGFAYLSSLPLWNLAEPVMEALVADVKESCSAAVLEGADIVYVLRVPTHKIMSITLGVGSRLPAYCTSMGRVLLAGLPDEDLEGYLDRVKLSRLTARTVATPAALRTELRKVRAQGYAIVDQELEEGLRSVAAPIRDRAGAVIGAANVSVHASRNSVESIRRDLLPHLLATVAKIDADLRIANPRRTRHRVG